MGVRRWVAAAAVASLGAVGAAALVGAEDGPRRAARAYLASAWRCDDSDSVGRVEWAELSGPVELIAADAAPLGGPASAVLARVRLAGPERKELLLVVRDGRVAAALPVEGRELVDARPGAVEDPAACQLANRYFPPDPGAGW